MRLVPRGTSKRDVPLNPLLTPFLSGCARLGIPLSPAQQTLFERYHAELLRWVHRVRLVSPHDLTRLPARHFLDSVLPLHVTVIPDGAACLDVGSGAGLPGLPIAICRPDVAMTLVESNRKKFLFLHHLIQSLPLPNGRAFLERVETLADHPLHAHTYDVAFVRAVGSLAAMVPAVFPLLKPGGHLVMHKGPDASQEIADAVDVLAPWAGCVEQCVSMTLPELPMTSTIVVVRKGTV